MDQATDIQATPHPAFRFMVADQGGGSAAMAPGPGAQFLAGVCDAAGVKAGEVIGVPAASLAALVPVLTAAASRDVAVLPFAPNAPPPEVEALLDAAGVEWLLRPDHGQLPELLARERRVSAGPIHPAPGLRLLMQTSGSSGAPRSVLLGKEQLAAAAAAANARLGLTEHDTWLACLPPHHIGGLAPYYRCALAGARLVALTGFDVEQVLHALRHHAVTHVSLVPAMLARLLDHGAPPPNSLRVALVGGQALDPGLAAAARGAGWPLCVSYGLTEAASQVAVDCSATAGDPAGCVGQPLAGLEISAGRPDAPAPVRLRGPMLMRGYATPPRRPGVGLEHGWYTSSDLGWLDDAGRLHIAGRADEVLISGGVKIHPARLEAMLSACPGIGSVGVTGVPDPSWGERLVAIYTGAVTTGALEQWCRDHLPGAMRPRVLLRLPELPLVGPGKLDRRRLRTWAGQAVARSGSGSPD